MTESAKAIFLSYASQDADAARRICDALRAAGLEVWFDQSELRGGDAWDASIRKQIKECALFVPIISGHTNARSEGYFRREWHLAETRMLDMADDQAFLVPVIIDDSPEPAARVPDKFRERQWSRLNDDRSIQRFVGHVVELIAGSVRPSSNTSSTPTGGEQSPTPPGIPSIAQKKAPRRVIAGKWIALGAAGAIAAIGVAWYALHGKTVSPPANADTTTATSTINPLSIMVMPFANQTGDKEKAYIADALTSSVTADLARIRDAFIVPVATAYSLADRKLSIPQLGKAAAVRFVLNGSVTSSGARLRIGASLADTQSGEQLWTENFDGELDNLFDLQDRVTIRIGNSIGMQMIIVSARESEKRKSTPQVTDLLMRAKALELKQQSLKTHKLIEGLYRQALAIEGDNLQAKTGLARNLAVQVDNFDVELGLDKKGRIGLAKEAVDLANAVREVDPQEPGVYLPIATYATLLGDLTGALQAQRRALELQPTRISAYTLLGLALLRMGEAQEATTVLQKGLQFASPARPPAEIYGLLSWAAFMLGRPDGAIEWAEKAVRTNPGRALYYSRLALAHALKGDRTQATKAAAEAVRLQPKLILNLGDTVPWPGREKQYQEYIDTRYLPAWRLAGLPE